jgi:hypothetical protein
VSPTGGRAVLACDVFADEIAHLQAEAGISLQSVTWLEMGLHDHPPRLRQAVQDAIAQIEANASVETILLAYGLCGQGLLGIRAARCPLVLPRAADCVAILLGGDARRDALLGDDPHTYFYSPGWVRGKRVPGPDRERHIRALYAERHDEETVEDLVEADREIFAPYRTACYVDITADQQAEVYSRHCAECLGWGFRRETGDPGMLRALLAGPWDEKDFLIVPPGMRIAMGPSLALRAEPA